MAAKLLFPGQTDGVNWVMKDGSVVPVTDMDDKHLSNSVDMLMRGIKSRQESVSLLLRERDRRAAEKLVKAKEARRMSPLATTTTRLFREED